MNTKSSKRLCLDFTFVNIMIDGMEFNLILKLCFLILDVIALLAVQIHNTQQLIV